MLSSARGCASMPLRRRAAIRGRGEAMFIQLAAEAATRLKGVRNATGMVGPPLDGIALRVIIGGHLANTPGEHAAMDPRSAADVARHRNAGP